MNLARNISRQVARQIARNLAARNGNAEPATPAAPVFSLQPSTQSVTAGDEVTFTVSFTGSPTPTGNWYSDDGSGAVILPGETGTSYVIASATVLEDGMQYFYRATNSEGTVDSNVAVLSVSAATAIPVFTINPISQSIGDGENVTFIVSVDGFPAPTLQWQVNEGVGYTDITAETSTSLSLTSVAVSADGNLYRCVATNSEGSTNSTAATLTVTSGGVAPTFTIQPLSQTVEEGTGVVFNATSTGSATIARQWQVDTGSGFANITDAIGETLTIASAALSQDGYLYRAVDTNSVGSTNSASATLTVTEAGVLPSQTSVTYGDVTWNFSAAVPVGTYATGEPYVVGAFTLSSTSPAATGTEFTARNGLEVNPAAGRSGTGAGLLQGFDGRIKGGSDSEAAPTYYSEALNLDPAIAGALAVSVNSTILKCISFDGVVSEVGNAQRTAPAMQSLHVLSCVGAAQATGAFRPPVRSTSKTTPANWTLAEMQSNMGIFTTNLDLSNATNYPEHTPVERSARLAKLQTCNYTLATQFNFLDTHSTRDGVRGYGRNYSLTVGRALMDLHSTISSAEKEDIAIAITQMGIDQYGLIADGGLWLANGAWYHARMALVLVAGLLLDDPFMQNAVLDPINSEIATGITRGQPLFSEQMTYDYIRAAGRTDGKGTAWGQYVGSSVAGPNIVLNRQDVIPFTTAMVGIPSWANTPYDYPERDGFATEHAGYKHNYNGSSLPVALGIELLNTLVDISALHAYLDTIWVLSKTWRAAYDLVYDAQDASRFSPGGTSNGVFAEVPEDVLNAYDSVTFSRTPWSGQPLPCLSPTVSVIGRAVTVTAFPYEFGNGNAITRRDIRWSDDDGSTWTTISDVPSTHTFTGPENSDLLIQVRVANSAGNGEWSVNEPNVTLANSSGLPAEATAARGVVSTTVTDTTAPVLSSPTSSVVSSTSGSGTVTTDEGNGTLYFVVTTSATAPTNIQIVAGQDNAGVAAADSGSQAVSATGSQSVSATGLTGGTTYYIHYVHHDVSSNVSNIVSSTSFETTSPSANLCAAGDFADAAEWSSSISGMTVTGGQLVIDPTVLANSVVINTSGNLTPVTPSVLHNFSVNIVTYAVAGKRLRFELRWATANDSVALTGVNVRVPASTVTPAGPGVISGTFTPPTGATWLMIAIVSIDAGADIVMDDIIITVA